MKNIKFIILFSLLLCIFLLPSCSNENNTDPISTLSESIQIDFNQKFESNLVIKDISSSGTYINIEVESKNQNEHGIVRYINNEWVMTTMSYSDISDLPTKVSDTFRNSHSSYSDLEISSIDIKGFDKEYYSFSFVKDTLDLRRLSYEVLINKDGRYLISRHEIPYDVIPFYNVDEGVALIKEKYKNASVCAIKNATSHPMYTILDDDIVKTVTLNKGMNELVWCKTSYSIAFSKVPVYVFEELKLQEPSVDLSNLYCVEYVENNDGLFYLVWIGDLKNSQGYYISVKD